MSVAYENADVTSDKDLVKRIMQQSRKIRQGKDRVPGGKDKRELKVTKNGTVDTLSAIYSLERSSASKAQGQRHLTEAKDVPGQHTDAPSTAKTSFKDIQVQ